METGKWSFLDIKILFCPRTQRSKDGTEQITFGELFKINERISSRFACILESARKYRLVIDHDKQFSEIIFQTNGLSWQETL